MSLIGVISRRKILLGFAGGSLALRVRAAAGETCSSSATCAGESYTGESIPSWTQAVYSGSVEAADGSTLYVPEGMVFVPAGEFVMGAQSSPGYRFNADGSLSNSNLDNRHTVALSAYCVSKYPVTNGQYRVFCDDAGSSYRPGGPRGGKSCYWDNPEFLWENRSNHPVLWVGYNKAQAYCDWVSMKTGWKMSLPSEAQWERAARGATATGAENLYPWGNSTSISDPVQRLNFNALVAMEAGTPRSVNGKEYPYWPFVIAQSGSGTTVSNFKGVAHSEDDARTADIDESSPEVAAAWTAIMLPGGYTTPVGKYPASPAGCCDMAGNAFEWTRDFYTISRYIEAAAQGADPCMDDASLLSDSDRKGGSDGTYSSAAGQATKIVRGGSWYANQTSCRTHFRTETRAPGNGGFHSVGFRVACAPPTFA